MKVQNCPQCGARYNVERLTGGARFKCRRCGEPVSVTDLARPAVSFSPGLLAAGTLMLAGLFLSLNPEFGALRTQWPWEALDTPMPLPFKAGLCLYGVTGIWLLVTSLGIAPRTRSVFAVALTGALLVLCTSEQGMEFAIRADYAKVHLLIATIALGAGLDLARRGGRGLVVRTLLLGGGIGLVWWFAFAVRGTDPAIGLMAEDLWNTVRGEPTGEPQSLLWHGIIPSWSLLITAVLGLLVTMGVARRPLAWVGLGLLLLAFIAPVGGDLIERLTRDASESMTGTEWASVGGQALISGGLAIFLAAVFAISDLAWNRGGVS